MCTKTMIKFYLESYWVANLHVQLVIYGSGSSLLSVMATKLSMQNVVRTFIANLTAVDYCE